jgi:hypothetical protein
MDLKDYCEHSKLPFLLATLVKRTIDNDRVSLKNVIALWAGKELVALGSVRACRIAGRENHVIVHDENKALFFPIAVFNRH